MAEKQKDFQLAQEGYVQCLAECSALDDSKTDDDIITEKDADGNIINSEDSMKKKTPNFFRELRGEIMLRLAVLRKEMGALDQAMQMCNTVAQDIFGDSIRSNGLCLKVRFTPFILYSHITPGTEGLDTLAPDLHGLYTIIGCESTLRYKLFYILLRRMCMSAHNPCDFSISKFLMNEWVEVQ